MSVHSPAIVFVDTETTGLDPRTERIFELAIAQNKQTWVWRFEPPADIVAVMHPRALEITRYSERVFKPDWIWDNELEALDGPVRKLLEGRHIAGAVPDFDTRHLTAAYERLGLVVPKWHYHLIDVETLMVGYLAARGVRVTLPWKSDELSKQIGVIPDPQRHEALYDARWAQSIFLTVMKNLSK